MLLKDSEITEDAVVIDDPVVVDDTDEVDETVAYQARRELKQMAEIRNKKTLALILGTLDRCVLDEYLYCV